MVPTSFSQSWHGGQGGETVRVGCRQVSDVTEAFRRPRPEVVTADMGSMQGFSGPLGTGDG